MLDKARAHRRKKSPPAHHEELPLLNTKVAGDFVQSVRGRLPELRERFGPFLRKTREKIDDVYSAAAQVLAEQKEAFEDRLAEKKNHARPTRPRKRRPAPVHPTEEKP